MGTVIWYTVQESFCRRYIFLALILSLIFPVVYLENVHFRADAEGYWAYLQGGRLRLPAKVYVLFSIHSLLVDAQEFWTIGAMIFCAPLLTSALQPGWVDLLASKAVSRWQIIMGRFTASTFMMIFLMLPAFVLPGVYLLQHVQGNSRGFLLALALQAFSFLCLAALMLVVAVVSPRSTLVLVAGVMQVTLSKILAWRAAAYDYYGLTSFRWLFEPLYYVLPKNEDLSEMGYRISASMSVDSWMPVWSSAIFFVGTLVASFVIIRRRSF